MSSVSSASSSTATLIPTHTTSQPAPKDYAAAFGNLQSTYGFGGFHQAPPPCLTRGSDTSVRASQQQRKTDQSKSGPWWHRSQSQSCSSSTTPTAPAPAPAAPAARPARDYDAAFARLQGTYGLAGTAPVISYTRTAL